MNALPRFFFLLIIILLALPSLAGGGAETDRDSDINESADISAPGPETTDAVPMDAEMAELLFDLGVMPFQSRIPSEDFVLATLGGGERALADYRGKVVFLNFWATWCVPCREEMPSMQVLYDELSDEGLEIIAVNLLEAEEMVSAFVEENEFTYPIMLDRDGRVSLRYSVRAIPTSYILDRDGSVIGVRAGFHDWSTPEIIDGFRKLLEL